MIIKQYGDLPITYAPDIGEVVLARRTPADRFVRAAVLYVRRRPDGKLRIKVQWLEDDDAAGYEHSNYHRAPIKANTVGVVIASTSPGDPQLIRQIDRGSSAPD